MRFLIARNPLLTVFVYLLSFSLALILIILSQIPITQANVSNVNGDPACGTSLFLPSVMNNFTTWETEPNDSLLEANGPLYSDTIYKGYPDDNNDLYFFDMETDGQIDVDLSQYTGGGGQLILYYETSDNVVGFDLAYPYQIKYDGAAGRYFAFIFTESSFNNVSPYTLKVIYPHPTPLSISFSDNFCGNEINTTQWTIEPDDEDFFFVQEGLLNIPAEVNSTGSFDDQLLEAELNNIQFSKVALRVTVDNGTNGNIGFNTSCSDNISAETLILSLSGTPINRIIGKYGTGSDLTELVWNEPLQFGHTYEIQLVQDGSIVNTYVDGVEMPEPFPCDALGDWLRLGAGSSPNGFVEGSYDFVRLFRSP